MGQFDTLTPALSLKGEGAENTLTSTLTLKGEGDRVGQMDTLIPTLKGAGAKTVHWSLLTVHCLLLTLLLAAALRFYRLDAQSFWNDEGNSARLSERPVALIIEGTASDIHPPLYYLILRGWRDLVGETEFGLRSFSAFIGVGLVAVTIALGQAMWGRQAGGAWLAGLFVTINPALVYYSQETRMYEFMAFLATLATLILWRWVSSFQFRVLSFRFQISGWVAYAFVIAAGLYTHYFFPAVILGHGFIVAAFVFNRQSKIVNRKLFYWLLALLIAGSLYLPWLPIFLRQASGRDTTTTPVLHFLRDSTQWLLLGGFTSPSLAREALVVTIGLLLTGFVLAISRVTSQANFSTHHAPRTTSLSTQHFVLITFFAIPITLMLIGGLTKEPFYKFMLMAIPPLALLLGGAVQVLWQKRATKVVGGLAAAFLTLSMLYATREMALNPAYTRANYRAIAHRIAQENHPNAGIILNAANQWEVFTYYHRAGAPTYPIPRGGRDRADIEGELATIAAQHDRLYAIFWGEAEQDPNRYVERWLDANTFKAVDEWVGDVRFVVYAVPSAAATEMITPLNLPFGDYITLQGVTIRETTRQPGDIIELTLFWQADVALNNRYKVFLHLVDGMGQLVNQRDSEPGGGLALTTTWTPGTTVQDNHGVLIPATVPSGTYTLLLGLYDLADPTLRLPITTNEGVKDALPLATIQIR